jgi:predicted acyltransferase
MRHTELSNREEFDVVEAPAVREASESRPQPAPAVPDMPKAAGVFMIIAYAAIMGAFVVTIRGAHAEFVIVIAAFYLMMFFALPAVFIGTEGDKTRRPDLVQFLDRGLETETGRISGGGALVQMLIVPVLLAFAILAMGITYLLV